jgi:Rha family phage regulatory protein
MNLVTSEISVSSRDIADMTGKRHAHVMRDIKVMLDGLEVAQSKFGSSYLDANNKERPMFILPKREALILASGYDVKLRAKIIDRLEYLEVKTKKVALPSKIELAQMVIEAETRVEQLNHKVEEKDKVILAVADLNIKVGNVSISDFAKNLAIKGLGRNKLFDWLKEKGYLMNNTEPYQIFVDRGYFVRKPSKEKIAGEYRYKTMLTPRGTVWLTKLLNEEFNLKG